MTVAEAATKIDVAGLECFLADISVGNLIWLISKYKFACIGFVFQFDLLEGGTSVA